MIWGEGPGHALIEIIVNFHIVISHPLISVPVVMWGGATTSAKLGVGELFTFMVYPHFPKRILSTIYKFVGQALKVWGFKEKITLKMPSSALAEEKEETVAGQPAPPNPGLQEVVGSPIPVMGPLHR